MLRPSFFNDSLFDDFFELPFYNDKAERKAEKKTERKLYGHQANHLMQTDIKETKEGYQLKIDLPGFKKDELSVQLDNGYLVISAEKKVDKDKPEKESVRYIRRERYTGSCRRSYYIGKEVRREDIKAEFKHGILKLFVPKQEVKSTVENKFISIEG